MEMKCLNTTLQGAGALRGSVQQKKNKYIFILQYIQGLTQFNYYFKQYKIIWMAVYLL